MGLFDWLTASPSKESLFIITEKDKYKCKICSMQSLDEDQMLKHIGFIHPEYLKYSDTEGKLPKVATSTWINAYYKFFFMPPKNWTPKQIEENVGFTRMILTNLVGSINRYEIENEPVGYINPAIGKTAIITHKRWDKGSRFTFRRVFTVKGSLSETEGIPEYLIRFREGGREGIDVNDQKVRGKDITPKDKLTYGYSPIDFIADRGLFLELDKAICAHFHMPHNYNETRALPKFNEKGEPIIEARLDNFFISHRVADRLTLHNECPEIEQACFPDKGMFDFIDYCRNNIKNQDASGAKYMTKWLKSVDKLLKKYSE